MTKQTIELNGKHYDAVTGELVSGAHKKPVTAQASVKKSPTKVSVQSKTAPNHTKAHAQQSSHTLMRKAVKKPAAATKYSVHVPITHSEGTPITVKHVAQTVDEGRLKRAQSVEQSAYVQRYNPIHHIPVTLSAVPVQPEPKVEEQEPPVAPPPLQHSIEMFERAIETPATT